jgi:hypothetical protein
LIVEPSVFTFSVSFVELVAPGDSDAHDGRASSRSASFIRASIVMRQRTTM